MSAFEALASAIAYHEGRTSVSESHRNLAEYLSSSLTAAGYRIGGDCARDGDLRMLGAVDGLAHTLLWVRNQIANIDDQYAPKIDPRHTRKRAHRDAVLRPLKELERKIAKNHADCSAAYGRSLQPKERSSDG